jgi:hypothetical protein
MIRIRNHYIVMGASRYDEVSFVPHLHKVGIFPARGR